MYDYLCTSAFECVFWMNACIQKGGACRQHDRHVCARLGWIPVIWQKFSEYSDFIARRPQTAEYNTAQWASSQNQRATSGLPDSSSDQCVPECNMFSAGMQKQHVFRRDAEVLQEAELGQCVRILPGDWFMSVLISCNFWSQLLVTLVESWFHDSESSSEKHVSMSQCEAIYLVCLSFQRVVFNPAFNFGINSLTLLAQAFSGANQCSVRVLEVGERSALRDEVALELLSDTKNTLSF